MTYEEIKILAEQLIQQYAPSLEKYTFIIVGVVCGVILFVNFLSMISRFKQANVKLKEISTPLQIKDEITAALSEKLSEMLNCSLDVNISAQISEAVEKAVKSFEEEAKNINAKLYADSRLTATVAEMMSTSRKITEEQRAQLAALIAESNSLINAPVAEEKSKLHLTMTSTENTESVPTKQSKKLTI